MPAVNSANVFNEYTSQWIHWQQSKSLYLGYQAMCWLLPGIFY
jgi:hypothetical protein